MDNIDKQLSEDIKEIKLYIGDLDRNSQVDLRDLREQIEELAAHIDEQTLRVKDLEIFIGNGFDSINKRLTESRGN